MTLNPHPVTEMLGTFRSRAVIPVFIVLLDNSALNLAIELHCDAVGMYKVLVCDQLGLGKIPRVVRAANNGAVVGLSVVGNSPAFRSLVALVALLTILALLVLILFILLIGTLSPPRHTMISPIPFTAQTSKVLACAEGIYVTP